MGKQNSLPPEHIGNIDAGFKRNEEIAKRTDALEEQMAKNAEDEGALEAIDEGKFRHIDNEVARHIGRDGHINISGKQDGYRYTFATHAQDYQGAARSNVRAMHAAMQSAGYEYVKGDDPEAKELIGNDCTSGTTLRGWGDTVLMRIREDDAQKQDARMDNKTARSGAVEEQLVSLGMKHGAIANGFAGELPNDPRMMHAFRGMGGPQRFVMQSNFTEGDMRRGSIPGIPAPGARR